MRTYQSIQAEIAKLKQQAETLKQAELKTVIAQLKKTIAKYGLVADDLDLGVAKPSAAARPKATAKAVKPGLANVGVPKYRDPKTLKTWTGRGKPPAWIAGVKNRDAFLIDPSPFATADAKPEQPARKARAVPAKPAAKKKVAAKTPAVEPPATTASPAETGPATE